MSIKISPSILASDFSVLGKESADCAKAGADMLHIDVMDGHFVPNITLGAPIVKAIRKSTNLVFDVHLMISDPIKYIPDFIQAGADLITVHAESDGNTAEAVDLILSAGKKAAVALKPASPAETVFPYIDKLSMVLVMTVEPGFGGQKFMLDQTNKIKAIRDYCNRRNIPMDIQVDGGINEQTLPIAFNAGANVFVAGSYVFGAENKAEAIMKLRRCV